MPLVIVSGGRCSSGLGVGRLGIGGLGVGGSGGLHEGGHSDEVGLVLVHEVVVVVSVAAEEVIVVMVVVMMTEATARMNILAGQSLGPQLQVQARTNHALNTLNAKMRTSSATNPIQSNIWRISAFLVDKSWIF